MAHYQKLVDEHLMVMDYKSNKGHFLWKHQAVSLYLLPIVLNSKQRDLDTIRFKK